MPKKCTISQRITASVELMYAAAKFNWTTAGVLMTRLVYEIPRRRDEEIPRRAISE